VIIIVDYGAGNLLSVRKAFEFIGEKVSVSCDPAQIQKAEKIVLPGVGAFGDAVIELKNRKLFDSVIDFAASGRPFLGVCLGLQLLLEGSEESPKEKGLGLLKGFNKVFSGELFEGATRLKVPHIGWNSLEVLNQNCPILKNVKQGSFFYFVHSFYADLAEDQYVAARTKYGISFPAILWKGNIFATQFHPEKSQNAGLEILKNFSAL